MPDRWLSSTCFWVGRSSAGWSRRQWRSPARRTASSNRPVISAQWTHRADKCDCPHVTTHSRGALKIWKLPVSALVAVIVLIGATACGGGTNVSGGTRTSTPLPSTPSVPPQDLDPSTYQSLSPRDYAVLVKDPDSNKGRKIIVYGVVTQFDAATGKTGLRVNTGAQPGNYSENTMIEAHDPSILANVVRGDAVTMWCQVQGAETYKTQNGGQRMVSKFWVNIIKDAGSAGSNP